MKNALKYLNCMALSLFLLACDSTVEEADKEGLKDFDIVIDWFNEPTYLGVYYAKSLGLYEDLGLNVNIIQAQGANQAVSAIASGKYDIATASGGATVLSYNNSDNIVSMGVLYKTISTVIYGLANNNIRTLDDLIGKKIGIYPGSITRNEFEAFMVSNGYTKDDFELVSLSGSDISLLMSGQIDAALNYAEMNPVILANSKSIEPVNGARTFEFYLGKNGVGGYGLNVISSRAALSDRPQLIKGVSKAIFKAYQMGCNDQKTATKTFLTEFPDKDPVYVIKGWARTCELIQGNYGNQSFEGWEKTISVYKTLGLLKSNPSPEDISE